MIHLGGTIACLDAADANDNGGVTSADADYVLAYLFRGGPAPAAPYPAKGNDSTADSLNCGEQGGGASGISFLRGDANADGRVDQSDTVRINEYLNDRGSISCLDAADTNDDGVVSTMDARALQGFLFLGSYPSPRQPYPTVGLDTTTDGLGCAAYRGSVAPTPSVSPSPSASPTVSPTPSGSPQPSTSPTSSASPAVSPTPAQSPVPPGATALYIRGDANGSGGLDISDTARILDYLVGRASIACLDAADVNDDGQITDADADAIQGYLFLGTHPAPRAPFPTRGADPTADQLGCTHVPFRLTPPAVTFLRGDADGSGRIDQADTLRILNYFNGIGPAPTCLDAADVDDDGWVSPFDAARLQRWLFLGGAAPAARTPLSIFL
ncbi:MAG: Regulator of chromosome condensation [Parcubacteria group bacterium Gr01-1014_31]|nr:MAG: Regulator of chromosome condensation [Parcubacteria group bacterium Gr01-1014_31]